MKIIDASVAVKWFVKEPAGQKAADSLLNEVESNPSAFAVPELFFAEMVNILCRIFQNQDTVKESISILENLGIERIGLGHEILDLAAETALKYKISGYDAIYVACAKLTDGRWYTFDQEAHKRLTRVNLSVILN